MKFPQLRLNSVTGITLLLLPLGYMVVYAVLFTEGYTTELRAMVIGAIVGKLVPDIVSYWLDSTAREAKKAEEVAKQPTPQVEVPAQTLDAIPEKKNDS